MSVATITHIHWVKFNADGTPNGRLTAPWADDGVAPFKPHPKTLPNRPKPLKS